MGRSRLHWAAAPKIGFRNSCAVHKLYSAMVRNVDIWRKAVQEDYCGRQTFPGAVQS